MIAPTFDYAVPKTLTEAVSLLNQNPEAKLLAGGHSLIPLMRFRLAAPALLIDLNRLSGLEYIREEGGRAEPGGGDAGGDCAEHPGRDGAGKAAGG